MTTRTEELEHAKAQMQSAPRMAPQPVEEEPVNNAPARFVAPPSQTQMAQQTSNAGEMSVMDFLQAASQPKFVDKVLPSNGKKIKVKKFNKGELDRISSPLFKRTMKLDLAKMGGNNAMNVDISMDLFSEMEKIMVEIGMCYYVDGRGQPVITREYIDTVMTEEDFKELSTLIKEVNPRAMMTGAEGQEVLDAKK